jgi:hypothetical protein
MLLKFFKLNTKEKTMKSIIKFIFTFSLLLWYLPSQAQFHQVWVAEYRGILWVIKDPKPSDNQLLAMAIDNNGYIYVTGMCDNPPDYNCNCSLHGSNICTKKYDSFSANGDTMWTQRYFHCGFDDVRGNSIAAVTVGSNTFVYVAGGDNSTCDNTKADYITIKYDAINGTPLWDNPRTYNGPLNGKDIATHVDGDASGNIYVTGESQVNTNGRFDWITIKYEANGSRSGTWTDQGDGVGIRRYTGSGDHECVPTMLKVDKTGTYIYVTGKSFDISNNQVIATVCYGCSDGATFGQKIYSGESGSTNIVNDMAVDIAHGVYITGSSGNNCVTFKYQPDLSGLPQPIWVASTDGGVNNSIDVYLHPVGGHTFCCIFDVIVTGQNGNSGQTIRYSDVGNTYTRQWSSTYGNKFVSLALDANENIYVFGQQDPDFLTAEYKSDGTLLDHKPYTCANDGIVPVGIKSDASGNVFTAAQCVYSTTSGIGKEYLIIKYSPGGGFGPNTVQNPNGNNVSTLSVPNDYALEQNYPNPFNPVTLIKYALPKAGNVKINVFDVLGREVSTIVNEYKEAGYYNIQFDGSSLPSGVYIYKINAGNFRDIKKMVLVK